MNITRFDYTLPKKIIANSPSVPRDHSRLLVLNRNTGNIEHKHFFDIADYLGKDDVLVFNNTKVLPARLIGKKNTGGKVELLLLENTDKINNIWKAMYKGSLKAGSILQFNSLNGKVIDVINGIALVHFDKELSDFFRIIDEIGQTPLPPYIKSPDKEKLLRKKYQTIYAKELGSAAAPTAGFHFTDSLFDKLKNKGVQIEYVTLHVGLGTFAPVKTNKLEEHKMHSEYLEINKKTADSLNKAKISGKRIIAVGTTTVRVLESAIFKNGELKKQNTYTEIFIYPPYKFKFVDALITNFHLPKSTLLALVSAFVSKPNTKYTFDGFDESIAGKAYKKAIENNYRFYSFGDAMLIV